MRITKTHAREPLRTCRTTVQGVEPGIETRSREPGGGGPVYGSTGVRPEGGVSVMQAGGRTGGTGRSDATGAAQAGSPRERQRTNAGHRDGVARRRDERSVMGPDRRRGGVRGDRAGHSHEADSQGARQTVLYCPT